MDAALWRDYLALLDTLGETLAKLTEVEQRKNAAVSVSDLPGLEACMKQEQVMSLSLRGLDQKRDKMLARMGLTGVPLRELEGHSPPELQVETRRTAESLRRKYEIFQSASEVARNTLECNLRAIEKLQQAEGAPMPELGQADFRA